MSITRALASAVSGLTATARGTETVASNMSNIMTPGYARREVMLMDDRIGGVRVKGVERMVNETLVAEVRGASTAQAEAKTRADFLQAMERLVGVPGDAASLGAAFSEFQASLVSAATRPDDNIRLSNVVSTASSLAAKLNGIGDGIQAARKNADSQIASNVAALNDGLARVADLNRKIVAQRSAGVEVASLEDERQTIVDRLSTIVPIRQIERQHGQIALFTASGGVLLDGSQPASFAFEPRNQITADMSLADGTLGALIYEGQPLTPDRMSYFSGGALAANFAIRDDLAINLQRDVDAIALDLHNRLADPGVDPSLAGAPGLFTDAGDLADIATVRGLASRIGVNTAITPASGGELWRIRAGIGAADAGPPGDSSLILRLGRAITDSRPMADPASFGGNQNMEGFAGQLASRVASLRVGADSSVAVTNARSSALQSRLLSEGVDSDDQMRRLLQYEHAYAANAKVIQTIDEMLNSILRI